MMRKAVQVNIPFAMLSQGYLSIFIEQELNPEIGLDARVLDHTPRADFEAVADLFHAQGRRITLHGPFIDLAAGSPDPLIQAATRQRLEQLLALVPVFKPRSVVCHAGYDDRRYEFMRDEWQANSLAVWRWFAEAVAGAGSRLMLENVYEKDPEDIGFLFRELGPAMVGLCLDTGHCRAFGESDPGTWIAALGPHIGQFHLHDNLGLRDDHLAPGRGCIDFEPVFSYLETRSADLPILTLEPHQEDQLWLSLACLETQAARILKKY